MNEDIKRLNVIQVGNQLEIVSHDEEGFIHLKTRSEGDSGGGATKIVATWYGYDIYLSKAAQHRIAMGASIVTVLSTAVPEAVVSKVIAILSGLCAIAAQELEYQYP